MPNDDNGGLPPHLDPRGGRRQNRPAAGRPQNRPAEAGGWDAQSRAAGTGLPPELNPRGRGASQDRKPRTWVFGALFGVKLVAAVVSLAVLVGSGVAWAGYRNFKASVTVLNIPKVSTPAATNNIDGTDQNILIVGNDDRSNATAAELKQLGTQDDGGSLNTDTMMMMHVPANGSKASVVSFPRDSLVTIPAPGGDVKAKLNAAYTLGIQDSPSHKDKAAGAALLIKTIENLTGLKIDHYVQIDLLGFYRISEAIGGVTICLNAAQQDSYSGINLPKGKSTIEGKQALAFVRQRHGLPGGDLDRIKRQQYFLAAVFRKITSGGTLLNPFKLQKLLKAISSSITTDGLDPLALAKQLQNLQAGNVTFTTIPTNGTADEQVMGETQNVVVIDSAKIPAFVQTLIGQDPATALKKAKAATPSSVTVAVVNDANGSGLENTNAAALRKAGFKTTVPAATSDVLDKTTIRYAKGQESAAKALQAQVPGAVLDNTGTSGVTLLLGNNGVQVKSLMPKTTKTTAPATTVTPAGTTTAADAGCIN